ncbi:hypothetical protein HYV88_00050 [Candidatus Woesearchaeota archaeon]|nr:hypothetical protein [Candidatus Woesearchaeota archaeon]
MNKKAQIEVMGLMVIVLILVFVILIALKFFLVPKTNTEEIQRQSIQASNMLNAIIRSNTEDGSTVTKKIVECYNSAGDIERCKFMKKCTDSTCPPINFERSILRRTFINKRYKLMFTAPGSNVLPIYQTIDPTSFDPGITCERINQASITGSATVSVSPPIVAKITVCVLPQESI